MNDRSSYWFGTWNCEHFDDIDVAEGTFWELADKCDGIVGQLECGEAGNYHLQFCAYFAQRKRGSWVKSHFCELAHFERCIDIPAARNYVTKEESRVAGPWERDFPTVGPGRRSDLDELKESLDEGLSIREISERHFGSFLRYERGITAYITMHSTPRSWEMDVRVFWGDTGLGKTRGVYEYAQTMGLEVYPLAQNYNGGVVWWDDYHGQDIVLIDDFYGWLPISYLLKLLDRYPFLIRSRSGHSQFSSHHIFITSNTDPSSWYPNAPEEVRAALRRRFSTVQHFQRLQ